LNVERLRVTFNSILSFLTSVVVEVKQVKAALAGDTEDKTARFVGQLQDADGTCLRLQF